MCRCSTARSTNYRQLRVELGGAGISFGTSSDTEVLLEAWRRRGPTSLPPLRGMFAIALFDELQCTATLAGDRWVDYVTNPDVPVTVAKTEGQ